MIRRRWTMVNCWLNTLHMPSFLNAIKTTFNFFLTSVARNMTQLRVSILWSLNLKQTFTYYHINLIIFSSAVKVSSFIISFFHGWAHLWARVRYPTSYLLQHSIIRVFILPFCLISCFSKLSKFILYCDLNILQLDQA